MEWNQFEEAVVDWLEDARMLINVKIAPTPINC